VSDATAGPIRLLLIDDHPSLREPLAELLDRQPDLLVVGQAGSLAEARAVLAARVAVDVALVDLELPDGNGTELIRELRHRNPAALALVLTASHDRREHAQAVMAGAAGVLHKSTPTRYLAEAIRRVCAGEHLLGREEIAELVRLVQAHQREDESARRIRADLRGRDWDLLHGLAQGWGDRQIATELGLSEKTVRNQMVALLGKLGAESRTQAVVIAARLGLVELR
jgi:DNA-binding NarL/FixJ family response regulator